VIPPVVVGSAARDLTPEDPRGWRLGGAVTYAGLTLARLGLRPRILLGVDEAGSAASELDLLRAAGADLRLVPLPASPVFENREGPSGRIQVCAEPGVRIPPAVPPDWAAAEAWFLGPVADELGPEWASVPRPGALVAVGWQGLLRELPRGGLVTRRRPSATPLIERATIVGLSHHDVDQDLTADELTRLLTPPATLVLTRGEAGGLVVELLAGGRRRSRVYPAIPADAVIDPTGAGDTFLAALMAARLGHPLAGSGRRGADLRLAAATASLVVEAPGLLGVPTLAAVAERMRLTLRRPGSSAEAGDPDIAQSAEADEAG
jgi:sugar/nucleoside kinase (ribokinase family)